MSPHKTHVCFLHLSAAAAARSCGQMLEDVAPQSLEGGAASCACLMPTYVRASIAVDFWQKAFHFSRARNMCLTLEGSFATLDMLRRTVSKELLSLVRA